MLDCQWGSRVHDCATIVTRTSNLVTHTPYKYTASPGLIPGARVEVALAADARIFDIRSADSSLLTDLHPLDVLTTTHSKFVDIPRILSYIVIPEKKIVSTFIRVGGCYYSSKVC